MEKKTKSCKIERDTKTIFDFKFGVIIIDKYTIDFDMFNCSQLEIIFIFKINFNLNFESLVFKSL